MSRYRFRLETVLRVRRAEESDARAALLRANAGLRRSLEVRDAAQQHYRDVVEHRRERRSVESLVRERWEAGLSADALAVAQRAAMRAAGEAALAQVDWAQAARRVAVLERLDQRRRTEHAEDERRAEHGVLDDLVTARYATVRQARRPGGAGAAGAPGSSARRSPGVGHPTLRVVRPGEGG